MHLLKISLNLKSSDTLKTSTTRGSRSVCFTCHQECTDCTYFVAKWCSCTWKGIIKSSAEKEFSKLGLSQLQEVLRQGKALWGSHGEHPDYKGIHFHKLHQAIISQRETWQDPCTRIFRPPWKTLGTDVLAMGLRGTLKY